MRINLTKLLEIHTRVIRVNDEIPTGIPMQITGDTTSFDRAYSFELEKTKNIETGVKFIMDTDFGGE